LPTLFNPDQASVFRDLASKAGLTKVELTIKYDQADDRADKAMRRLCEEVNKLIGVNLTPEPMEAHALRDDLEKKQTYDLAYYHFDYASESFWLWPLLDLNGNYFNWQDDGRFALVPLFDQALNERNFADLQRLTRQIHGVFSKQVPFVPLWQLDSYIAHDRNLKAVFSDPLLVFPGAEQWALEKQ
jgi:ABC-type transport system substrate-binding protein